MSENETHVEKSAEEQLVDVIKTEVAGKADVEAVEAVKAAVDAIEIPSTEGLVEKADLDAANTEIEALKGQLDELNVKFDAMPAIVTKESPEMKSFNWDAEGFTAKTEVDLSEEITKAYNPTTQVTGEPTSTARLYYALQQSNPFRMVSTVMPMNSSTMELPEVTGITAQHEGNIPASINTASGHGGGLSTVQLVTQNWTSRTAFSDQSIMDLPGLDSMVGGFIGQQIGVAEAVDMVAQIKSHVNAAGTVNRVTTTGGAVSLDNFVALRDGISSAYLPNAKFMMSRPIYGDLRTLSQSGSGSDLVWDPVMGKMTLFGHDVIINDHLENFGAANNLLCLFGDFARGTVIGNRRSMVISRHDDTIPGAVYYYGNMRSRGQSWDGEAYFALRSNA